MKISCPHCGQHYEVDDEALGAIATCECCKKDFTVAETPPPPPKFNEQPLPASTSAPATTYCPYCGGEITPGVKKCRHCGEWLNSSDKPKSPLIYVLLAFFFGMFGVHNFYSGAKAKGWIKLLLLFGTIPVYCLIIRIIGLFWTDEVYEHFIELCWTVFFLCLFFTWGISVVWCIVEMFCCRKEVESGNIPLSRKMKLTLTLISIFFAGLVIFQIIRAIGVFVSISLSR